MDFIYKGSNFNHEGVFEYNFNVKNVEPLILLGFYPNINLDKPHYDLFFKITFDPKKFGFLFETGDEIMPDNYHRIISFKQPLRGDFFKKVEKIITGLKEGDKAENDYLNVLLTHLSKMNNSNNRIINLKDKFVKKDYHTMEELIINSENKEGYTKRELIITKENKKGHTKRELINKERELINKINKIDEEFKKYLEL